MRNGNHEDDSIRTMYQPFDDMASSAEFIARERGESFSELIPRHGIGRSSAEFIARERAAGYK